MGSKCVERRRREGCSYIPLYTAPALLRVGLKHLRTPSNWPEIDQRHTDTPLHLFLWDDQVIILNHLPRQQVFFLDLFIHPFLFLFLVGFASFYFCVSDSPIIDFLKILFTCISIRIFNLMRLYDCFI